MNANTSGAVLLLILASSGLAYDQPLAVFFAGLSAAQAFVAEDLRNYTEGPFTPAAKVAFVLAVLSWLAVFASFLSLMI